MKGKLLMKKRAWLSAILCIVLCFCGNRPLLSSNLELNSILAEEFDNLIEMYARKLLNISINPIKTKSAPGLLLMRCFALWGITLSVKTSSVLPSLQEVRS